MRRSCRRARGSASPRRAPGARRPGPRSVRPSASAPGRRSASSPPGRHSRSAPTGSGCSRLAGRGPAFSTGGDVREFGSAPSPFLARAVRWRRDVWGRLLELGAATVAAVHGYAVGGGMEMALLCDLCVAADDARFALPETGLGMIPGVGGTQTLPRKAGTAAALDLVLTGRWLDDRAALAAALVGRVVGAARLGAAAPPP